MSTQMIVPFEFDHATLFDIHELNTSFARGSLKVMYVGDNRNNSNIEKDVVVKALPTLYNVPIVAHWIYEDNTIGGHDVELVHDERGLRMRTLTEPCGVVPEHAVFRFEEMEDENGEAHEYLIVDGVLLWKRQDVYRHIVSDLGGRVKHSMEISVKSGEKNTGTGRYVVKDFEFTALCLLETCDPCFQGSELQVYSAQNFKQKMEQMMQELKESYSLIDPSKEDARIDIFNANTEGGEKVLQEKLDLAESYGINIDELDFTLEDYSLDELKEKFEAMTNQQESQEEQEEEQSFELNSNIAEEISRVLSDSEILHKEWGDVRRYCYVDHDAELGEVYAWDHNDWLLYGFRYSMNGDSVTIDLESKKRMKFAIVPFENGEQASPVAAIFTEWESKLSANTELEKKFQDASETIQLMETELGELRQFKADAENAALESAREAVFARFDDLAGVEAFEDLREHSADYSDMNALEEKCFAIRGRQGVQAQFSLEGKSPKLIVEKSENENEPYGGIFARYGIEANN